MEYFGYYLTDEEKTSFVTQWPALRTRLIRQKIINPSKAFISFFASRLDDVRDFPILLYLILALPLSAAKCLWTTHSEHPVGIDKKTLFRQHMKAYIPDQAIIN